jgi:hypothetical protein
MRKFSKSIKYSLMISSFMIAATSHLKAATCPTLNRDQIRTLCRWDALKNIPLLKIEAKKITIDGATLQNKHDSCREKDAVKQFVMKNIEQTYVGKVSKDFKAPNDHSQVLCLYTIDKEVFGFSAEGVPHPDAGAKKENTPSPVHRKDPRTFGGVDITVSPKVQQVPLKEPSHNPTQTAPQRLNQPPRPNPLSSHLANQSEDTPPNYPPPKTPNEQMANKHQTAQYDEPLLGGGPQMPKRQPPPLPPRPTPTQNQ